MGYFNDIWELYSKLLSYSTYENVKFLSIIRGDFGQICALREGE
jgi:hypothetical protein